jgi:serine/threonine protein kinase
MRECGIARDAINTHPQRQLQPCFSFRCHSSYGLPHFEGRPNPKRQNRVLHDHEAAAGMCLACKVCFLSLQYRSSTNACRNQDKDNVVIKSVHHFRLRNERDILLRLQSQTPLLRPLLDEIEDPPNPPALVLKYLEDDLLHASNTRRLTRPEVKYVTKKVLEALEVLHGHGFIHTGTLGP